MSDSKWRPSKGGYGWFGSYKKSNYGKQRRGKMADSADMEIINEANDRLAVLRSKYKKLTSGDSIYDYVKKVQSTEATMVAEEGMGEIAATASASGFAGGGDAAKSRKNLLKRLQGSVGKIMRQQDAEKKSTIDSITGNMNEIIAGVRQTVAASGDTWNPGDIMDTHVPGNYGEKSDSGGGD